MPRLKVILSLLIVSLASTGVVARRVNNTIYDTHPTRITYEPNEDFCAKWNDKVLWKTCETWAQSWRSEVYHSQGRVATFHQSLDHELSSMIIDFEGSAVWLYGPPRSQISIIPVEYKICLRENHHMASDVLCYRVNVAEAYSHEDNYESPVVIFAKGDLQPHEHRIVISVAEPVGEVSQYQGIQFSHAVYTTERPTPWPIEQDAWRFRQVIMHDTHPLLSYWPREPVSSGSSKIPFEFGWSPKTYTAEDGSRVTWHELRSRDQENRDRWGVDATIKAAAGVVELYGVPKAHITDTDYLSPICVRINSGNCEIVDLKHAYLETNHRHEAVLLWRSDALDPDLRTHIAVRLVESEGKDMSVFPFKEIRYFEKQEYSRDIASPDLPSVQTKTVSVSHDDTAVVYYPGRRCLAWTGWWCSDWFDPWVWKEAAEGFTYRSTVWSYRESEDPSITLEFQGSEVHVYGAPKSLVKGPLASQHVCINDVCHLIDAEQAYLNAPTSLIESSSINSTSLTLSPKLEPVLLWSQTGLDDQTQHTLRLALAPLHSQDDAEMTIAKITYTRFSGHSRPDTPIPPPDESYEGPLFPPYAEKWAPRPPSPPPKHEPKPEPVPHPQPSTSHSHPEPEPTYPSTAHPVPTGSPGSTHPHPLPSPESEPESPSLFFTLLGWSLFLFGLGSLVVAKRRLDQKRRELQWLLDARLDQAHLNFESGHWGSTIYEGTSTYGGTNPGYGSVRGGPTHYGRPSTPGSTAPQGSSGLNYGQPPPSHRGDGSVFSGTSTRLPTYSDVIREQQTRTQRTQTFVAQQRGGRR
ncbi:hypothetical protein RHS04_07044 [Rhizoctonia solani]|uniref:Transmembrane protein n=1 Tax=Rhizoctonia solani TaxID=456999 RepID=A0A8H7H2K3_9AGAM|nr:hypothetical protein RHS04_07044 [Rhizoctonia solani]